MISIKTNRKKTDSIAYALVVNKEIQNTIESTLLLCLQKNNPKKYIIGVRELKNIRTNIWTFRYTYQDGDFLSISNKNTASIKNDKVKLYKTEK